MKFQKMIRVQLMLMGLGAGLLLAKPVFAQQDMDPTLFEAASDASQLDQAGFNVPAAPSAATNATVEIASSLAGQESDAAGLSPVDVNTILALMVSLGSIVLLGIAEVVRGSRRRTWRAQASSAFPNGATAN